LIDLYEKYLQKTFRRTFGTPCISHLQIMFPFRSYFSAHAIISLSSVDIFIKHDLEL